MTTIINILHPDFSILAADTQGQTNGPTEMKVGNISIKAQKGVTIIGVQKLFSNVDRHLAVGFAGTVKNHPYAPEIERCSVDDALDKIQAHTQASLRLHHRDQILALGTYMDDSSITSFFDAQLSEYFSVYNSFTPREIYTEVNAAKRGRLLTHAGSGSSKLNEALGKQNIHEFVSSVTVETIPRCLAWLEETFRKVSALDPGTGEEFVALISTRDDPRFKTVPRSA